MKPVDTPWNLPDTRAEARAEKARAADDEVRVSDFLLFAALPLRVVSVAGLPVNELAMLAVVGLAVLRKPDGGRPLRPLVVLLGVAMVAFLLLSGLANGVDWTRRVGHVAIWVGLVWAIGTGRVSLRSAALGAATGLVGVIGLYQVGIGGDAYVGRLTGYLGDPNAGAYFILVLGVLAVGFATRRGRLRLLLAAPLVAGLVLTYSRTGLLALAFALLWWVVGRRLGALGGAATVAVLVWVTDNVPEDLKVFGPFSNRSGSDALRERIVTREYELLAAAPWYGNGPGTAQVTLGDDTFFFHNSYLAARQEGGWLLLALVLAVVALGFLAASARSRRGDVPAVAAQTALIGAVVMSVTLGEVLLELPTAIALGFALCVARNDYSTGQEIDPPVLVTPPREARPLFNNGAALGPHRTQYPGPAHQEVES